MWHDAFEPGASVTASDASTQRIEIAIGKIQSAAGVVTITRGDAVLAQPEVGARLYEGDLIETGIDGDVHLSFIDGTTFQLFAGSRVILDKFVYVADASNNEGLLRVVKGKFGFMAGKVAGSGTFAVDTPLTTVRSTAAAGLGSLAFALVLGLIQEAQGSGLIDDGDPALDEQLTFVDDGTIVFSDLEHGIFEIITKETVPRVIVVDDPAKVFVFHLRGSSISLEIVSNTMEQMLSLQSAYQTAFATFIAGQSFTQQFQGQPLSHHAGTTIVPSPFFDFSSAVLLANTTTAAASHVGPNPTVNNNIILGGQSFVTLPAIIKVLPISNDQHQPVFLGPADAAHPGAPIVSVVVPADDRQTLVFVHITGLPDGETITDGNGNVYSGSDFKILAADFRSGLTLSAGLGVPGTLHISATVLGPAGPLESTPVDMPLTLDLSGAVHWINSSGGDWNEPANWSTGSVPIPFEDVIIDAPGTYTVTSSHAVSVDSVLVSSGATLSITGSAFSLTTANAHPLSNAGVILIGLGASMTVGESHFAGAALNSGTIEVAGGSLNLINLTVTNTGTFHLTTGTIDGGDIDNFGRVISNGASFLTSVALINESGSALEVVTGNLTATVALTFGANTTLLLDATSSALTDPAGIILAGGTISGLGHLADGTNLTGWGTVNIRFDSADVVTAVGGVLEFTDNVDATAVTTFHIANLAGSILKFDGGVGAGATIVFDGGDDGVGVLDLSASLTNFHGTLSGFDEFDGIKIAGAHHATLDGSGTTLSVFTAANVTLATLKLAVSYAGDTFYINSSGLIAVENLVAFGSASLNAVGDDTLPSAPGETVAALFSGNFLDGPHDFPFGSLPITFTGIAISNYTAVPAQGAWQYSTDNGATWTSLVDATAGTAIVLHDTDQLRFLRTPGYSGPSTTLDAHLIESGQVFVSGDTLDLTLPGAIGHTSHISSGTVTLNESVNAIDDAPVNSVPGLQTVNEDTALVFSGGNLISISDVDVDETAAPGNTEQVTLSVAHGTLSLSGIVGLSFSSGDGSGDTSMTFSGTVAAINAALAGLSYQGLQDYNGSDTLTITTNDLGHTGLGGPLSDTDTVAINITPVNDAPVNSVPGLQTVNEDTALVFSGGNLISISDVDEVLAPGNTEQVTLSVAHGTLSLSGIVGLSFSSGDGSGDTSMTFSGTVAAINAALAGLSYQGLQDYNGSDTLTITTNDLGHTGLGGPLSDPDTVAINITPVNDAPVNSVPGLQTVNEDTALVFSGGNLISISDVDEVLAPGNTEQVTLSVAHGTLSLSGIVGLSFSSGDGSGDTSMTFSGTVAAINAALAGLSYQGLQDYNGSDTLTITTNDLGHTGLGGPLSDPDTVAINITPVNDAPVNSVPGLQTVNEDTALVFSGGNLISISDVDEVLAPGNTEQVTLSVAHGTLSLSGIVGLSFSSGDGSGDTSMTFSGTVAAINAALAGLSYQGLQDYNGSDTLTITTNDLGHTGLGGPLSDPDTVAINITPVNDAPVNSVPGLQTVNEDTALVFSGGNLISISDVDEVLAPGNTEQVTLSVAHGTLSLSGIVGLSFSSGDGSGDTSMTFSGTVAAINAALAGLSYQGLQDYNGSDTLTITTNDLGHTGLGGPLSDTDTVAINITPVNDAPVNSVPGLQTVNEDTALVFSGGNLISISDVDEVLAPGNTEQVTLSVAHGTLSLSGIVGLSFSSGDGSGDTSMTFSGTVAAINAALAGLSYQGLQDYNGSDTLTITTNDLGHTGLGGPLSDPDTVAINITPVNDAPVNSVPGLQTVNEDTALVFSGGNLISISDVDEVLAPGNTEQVTLSVAHGTLSLSGIVGLSFSSGDGSGDTSMTFSGTVAAINAALAGLSYQGLQDYNGSDTLTITTNDLGHTGLGGPLSDPDTVAINITPVNDAPVGTPDIIFTNVNNGSSVSLSDALLLANDTDVDGPSLTVLSETSGTAAVSHGGTTTTLTPNINAAGTSTFSYTATDGSLNTAATTVTVNRASTNLLITGSAGNDILIDGRGDGTNATLDGRGGSDLIVGGTDNNAIVADQSDVLIDGGGGTDMLLLNSNFADTGNAQIVNVEVVNFRAPDLTVDLSHQTEGFTFNLTTGLENLTTGSGANTVIVSGGGTPDGFGGANATLNNGDIITGGAGVDVLSLNVGGAATTHPSYSFTFGDGVHSDIGLANFETMTVTGAGQNGGTQSDNVTLTFDANFDNHGLLTVNASALSNLQLLTIDASAVTTGTFVIIGSSSGASVLKGGTGNDTISGGSGADDFFGGGGADAFKYSAISNSPHTSADTIHDFSHVESDRIDLTAFAANTFTTFKTGPLASAASPVTAHTIAWYFDGTKTIVYANPTASSLNGGSPGMLEINLTGVTSLQASDFVAANSLGTVAPAGLAGEPINLALSAPSGAVSMTATLANVPSGWTLNEGADNGDGSWTVETRNPSSLTITAPAGFAGSVLLDVSETWTNADGSTETAIIPDNVEVFPESTIYAWSGDDTLTGSAGSDQFVFAGPIGNDAIYGFDGANDQINLIGFGITSFAEIKSNIADDAYGNAVISLADGASITVMAVNAASLGDDNFVFDQSTTLNSSSAITISDGAMLPLVGTVNNASTISLDSHGHQTELEILAPGVTLQGGGQLTLSPNSGNLISGSTADATLTNFDNAIFGAGQLGGGQMQLVNATAGVINANAAGQLLVLDIGAHSVINHGTIEATAGGNMAIESDISNAGILAVGIGSSMLINGSLANSGSVETSGNLHVFGTVTGSGTMSVNSSGTLELASAASNNIVFANNAGTTGELVLGDSAHFHGLILGFAGDGTLANSDLIDLRDVLFRDVAIGHTSYHDDGGSGTLILHDQSEHVVGSLTFVGNYDVSNFTIVSDGHGGTLIIDPPTHTADSFNLNDLPEPIRFGATLSEELTHDHHEIVLRSNLQSLFDDAEDSQSAQSSGHMDGVPVTSGPWESMHHNDILHP